MPLLVGSDHSPIILGPTPPGNFYISTVPHPHFSNFKIWIFPPFSWLGKNILKKQYLRLKLADIEKIIFITHATYQLKTSLFFSGSNLCFGIQRQGPQDVEDSAKDGCGAWDAQNKKRMTYIMEGALCWKGWIFLATGSVACRSWVQCYGLGWKNLEDLHGSLPKGSDPIRSVKMMENMGSPKKTWVDHGRPTCFFVWPSQFFLFTSLLLLSRRSHGGMLLPLPVAPNKCKSAS